MISVFSPDETARVISRRRRETRAFLGNIFCLGSYWSILHRKVCAVTHETSVLVQMVTIRKEKELSCFHLVERLRRSASSETGTTLERLRRLADGCGDMKSCRDPHNESKHL